MSNRFVPMSKAAAAEMRAAAANFRAQQEALNACRSTRKTMESMVRRNTRTLQPTQL